MVNIALTHKCKIVLMSGSQIQSNQKQGKILDYRLHRLSTSGSDLESQFAENVSQLKMDLEGLLVEKVLIADIFERFAQPWLEAISVWIEACNAIDECESGLKMHLTLQTDVGKGDWRLLAHVLGAYFTLLLFISREVVSRWGHDENAVPMLPLLNSKSIQDAEYVLNHQILSLRCLNVSLRSTQMAFRLWLQSPALSEISLARHLSSFDFSDCS
jgi:hypothetical protein